MAQAGGSAKIVGISGAGTYHDITNNTLAYIEDTARVEVNKDVQVQADSNLISVIVDGAIQKQKSDSKNPYAVVQKGSGIAVGVAIAINTIENNTLSFIGDLPVDQGGSTADDRPGYAWLCQSRGYLCTVERTRAALCCRHRRCRGQGPEAEHIL